MTSLRTVTPFHWFAILPALAVGVLGVLDVWANMYALFAALLLLAVITQFAWRAGHTAFVDASDIAVYARRLSRQIYLLLYTLAAVKEIQFLWTSYDSGTSAGSGVSVGSLADFMKGLQAYLGCGILALAAIRILAALRLHFLATRARPIQQQ
jgi:hypothetical protein